MSGQVGVGREAAPSLVRARQRSGKNICPKQSGLSTLRNGGLTGSPRVEALRKRIGPCTALPAGRIRLVNLADPSKTAPIRCKRWNHHSCSNCGDWMRGRFIRVTREQAQEHNLTRFLTLTLGPEARDLPLRDQFKLMSKAWASFRKRVAEKPTHVRKDGTPATKPLSAIWVREQHKDGSPHLHVVIDRYLPQRWVSQTWERCGGGPIVDIRKCSIDRIVAYISKYLAKGLNASSDREVQHFRRYGATGDASCEGVYPVKRTDDPWWVEWKPEEPSCITKPNGWQLCTVGDVSTVMMDVIARYGSGSALPPDPGRMESARTERTRQRTALEAAIAAQRAKAAAMEIPAPAYWRATS